MAVIRLLACLNALFHVGFLPVNALLQAQHVLLFLLGVLLILAVVSCTGTRAADRQFFRVAKAGLLLRSKSEGRLAIELFQQNQY